MVVAFRGDEDGGVGRCRSQQGDVGQINMSRGRAAEKNNIEFLAAAQERGQLGSRRHVGNAPALRLMIESQLEAVASQLALIDNG